MKRFFILFPILLVFGTALGADTVFLYVTDPYPGDQRRGPRPAEHLVDGIMDAFFEHGHIITDYISSEKGEEGDAPRRRGKMAGASHLVEVSLHYINSPDTTQPVLAYLKYRLRSLMEDRVVLEGVMRREDYSYLEDTMKEPEILFVMGTALGAPFWEAVDAPGGW